MQTGAAGRSRAVRGGWGGVRRGMGCVGGRTARDASVRLGAALYAGARAPSAGAGFIRERTSYEIRGGREVTPERTGAAVGVRARPARRPAATARRERRHLPGPDFSALDIPAWTSPPGEAAATAGPPGRARSAGRGPHDAPIAPDAPDASRRRADRTPPGRTARKRERSAAGADRGAAPSGAQRPYPYAPERDEFDAFG